jgi:DNA-binding response OmpR family regulator
MLKILLAEDDATMLTLLKTLLTLEGFLVASIQPSDETVLAAVRREMPDILLLDINLPEENGLEVLKAIRADDQLGSLRVILTSGTDFTFEGMAGGADGFLLKPYMPDDLVSLIQQGQQKSL